MTTLRVFVPRPGSDLRERIWCGSGIVGSTYGSTNRLRIDYEGADDRYPKFVDRVRRAAERHEWSSGDRAGYPTRACAYVDEEEVVAVGSFDTDSNELTVEDSETLRAWVDREDP